MLAPISEDARNQAARTVDYAIRKAHPGIEGDLETHLMIAYAMRQYARYAASDRFGPDHDISRAFLDLATSLAVPISDETERLLMATLDGPVAG